MGGSRIGALQENRVAEREPAENHTIFRQYHLECPQVQGATRGLDATLTIFGLSGRFQELGEYSVRPQRMTGIRPLDAAVGTKDQGGLTQLSFSAPCLNVCSLRNYPLH